MAEFKLGRIRFVWKGDWAGSTTYYKDDVVKYGGRTYICAVGHTADSDFYTDLNIVPSKWNQMTDGQSWKGDWTIATDYVINDVVKYGGNLYIANAAHTSAATTALGLEDDQSSWTTYAEGTDWKGNWTVNTRYKLNDLVKYGGNTYLCSTGHTSAATTADGLEQDIGNWDKYNDGIDYKGAWVTATRYKEYDVVKYGANLYIVKAGQHHTASADFSTDQSARWDNFVEGFNYENTYAAGTEYKPGDVVHYGGNTYVAKTISTGQTPPVNASDWDLFATGFKYINNWSIATSYKIGEVVTLNGYTYRAVQDAPSVSMSVTASDNGTLIFTADDTTGLAVGQVIQFTGTTFGNVFTGGTYYVKTVDSATQFTIATVSGGTTFNPTTDTGTMTANATWHPAATAYWNKLNEGISWQGEWTDDYEYEVGDAVKFGDNAFICIQKHRSEGDTDSTIGAEGGGAANSRPDLDITGTYWNQLITGSETSILTNTGDLVYFGGSGVTRLPIGKEGEVLRAGAEYPEWALLGQSNYVYWVAEHGQDKPYPLAGGTVDKPFASVRYACHQIDQGALNSNAKDLLRKNRHFIQREVTEWIDYQVEYFTNTAPDVTSIWYNFTYDDAKCERDTGFIVDALVYDLSTGGNVKSRGAANSYIGALSESEVVAYPNLSAEKDQDIAAFNYMLTLLGHVFAQTDPAVNYQSTNGDNSTSIVTQHKDATIAAESGILAKATALVTIVLNALEDEDASRVPARYMPNSLVKVKTGTYTEVGPILVPENTCVIGEEVRSTTVTMDLGTTHKTDTKYTIETYAHLNDVVQKIVTGATVTATTGNAETQSIAVPFGDTPEAARVDRLMGALIHNTDFRVGTFAHSFRTDPTGYNVGYLTGYGDARSQLSENKEFLKAEVTAYIADQYPNVYYSRTKCKQDVGYILDALTYDMTYGGNSQAIRSGLAYYDGPGGPYAGNFGLDSNEKAATVASYEFMRDQLADIVLDQTATTKQSTVKQFKFGTSAGNTAKDRVVELMNIIIDLIQGGATTSAPNVEVDSISSNVITTTTSHGLSVGDSFTPRTTGNGLTTDQKYWVVSTPAATTLTVSTVFNGSAATLTNGSSLGIIADVVEEPAATNGVSTTTALITAAQNVDAAQESMVTAMSNAIAATYPNLTYNADKCKRDARLISEAVMFDFMFNSNHKTLKAAYAYLRSTASDVYDKGQKAATIYAFDFIKDYMDGVAGDATAEARIETLMEDLLDIIYSGSTEGSRCLSNERNIHHAATQILRNKDFIVAESTAYIADTYKGTVTATTASDKSITISDTSWLQRGTAIKFSGTIVGAPSLADNSDGIIAGTTYYVHNILSATKFQISNVRNDENGARAMVDDTGSATVAMTYNSELCERDVKEILEALIYDITYPGNYKTLLCARYYGNAVVGSHEEDLYYLRNGTGIRNQTLRGMNGDLLAQNANGTRRVSGGAYCSLDPGWGPEDYRVWITARSPYVQNNTTFGNAGIGQKIDGALHNGGNDSIVSNDFTQVISDGIGAWVTNNGRAELVSVFTYYSHIGYLSENGGRIRGTNGNNSYGDFGSVAEGFDSTETPETAIVDNKFQYEATVIDVTTDNATEVYAFEFGNAGIDYEEAEFLISGAGTGAFALVDEFRDNAVHSVFLEDNVDDSANAPEVVGNFGGFGYISNANTAQGGTSNTITLAATDAEISSAYVGMKVYVTGGSGVGQFGIISAYNNGTKLANVTRESDGASGWDHIVAGTSIVAPDASSTYIVEPRLEFNAPGYTHSVATLPSTGSWTAAQFVDTAEVYLPTSSGGTGSSASFQVIKNGWKYAVSITSGGTGYTRLDEITINGSDLGGVDGTNDVTITVTAINSATGEILEIDTEGYGRAGAWVAVKSGSAAGARSVDGESWSATTLPSASNWTAMASGKIDDGSSVSKVSRIVAVASGTSNAAYSADGVTWTATSMPASANWIDVAYDNYNQRFVAIASDSSTVAISLDGEVWDTTGTLNSTGFTAITAGQGILIAVKSGTQTSAYSIDGGVSWIDVSTLPAASAWSSVAFGQNHFVATATDSSTVAISIDKGATWISKDISSPDSTTPAGLQQIKYGQGQFMITAYKAGVDGQGYTYVAVSQDGYNFDWKGVGSGDITSNGFSAVAFGTHQRVGYWAIIDNDSSDQAVRIKTGATTKARAGVAQNKIFEIRITEPGSGYDTAPTMTITDPSEIYALPQQVRTGSGVLATPSFRSRGTGYVSASADLTAGNGYADFFQSGNFIAIRQLSALPPTGSNIVFGHLPNQTFKLVNIVTLLGSNDGALTCFLQISPEMKVINVPPHGTSVTTRIRYSQVRLTGHDFLDIGTGSFTETNYPNDPLQDPVQANETKEANGGRVFFTATDQDGNFRVGDLFSIEQSTGVATLNADAFNIAGLQELSLGEVTLGGGSASIDEFSTDPFFTADSDNVVPTQRAIKAYISSQIGGGGASLNVNSVTAGFIYIAADAITTTTQQAINVNANMNFKGGVRGLPVAWSYFLT